MDAAAAIADLKQVSSQIDRVVIAGHDGAVEACSLPDPASASRMAVAARDLYDAAERARGVLGRADLTQLEVSTPDGSVFAVRDATRLVCAVTRPDPTVGLVFYDLKACLRAIAEEAADGAS
jgi:predicted regulator of Ras-like GTPase activity (Roadblock/LC7/MglB family)